MVWVVGHLAGASAHVPLDIVPGSDGLTLTFGGATLHDTTVRLAGDGAENGVQARVVHAEGDGRRNANPRGGPD